MDCFIEFINHDTIKVLYSQAANRDLLLNIINKHRHAVNCNKENLIIRTNVKLLVFRCWNQF